MIDKDTTRQPRLLETRMFVNDLGWALKIRYLQHEAKGETSTGL